MIAELTVTPYMLFLINKFVNRRYLFDKEVLEIFCSIHENGWAEMTKGDEEERKSVPQPGSGDRIERLKPTQERSK